MKQDNINSLERLSLFCHISGLISILLGISVIFMDIINGDFSHIIVGLFIFITGYTFVKIAQKIAKVLLTEKSNF